MRIAVLGAFAAALLVSILSGTNIIWALLVGLVDFVAYAFWRGLRPRQVLDAASSGFLMLLPVMVTLLIIGMLTASWRASGTIACLVTYAADLITPRLCLLMAFLLNAGLSVLIGTSFGTVATMGVICWTTAIAMHIDPILAGGAVMSGIYVGDRCSPLSTSAMVVVAVTQTELYRNIRGMIRTGWVPFVVTAAAYLAFGMLAETGSSDLDVAQVLRRNFDLSVWTLVPAVTVIVMALMRVNLRWLFIAGVLIACAVCVFVQGMGIGEIAHTLVFGYEAADPELSRMINGGGMVSMVDVVVILMVSSTFSGLIKATNLLDGVHDYIARLSNIVTPFGALVLVSIPAAMLFCNQVLTVMIGQELLGRVQTDRWQMAIDLENSAILIPGLIPWCIACAVPMSTLGAPWAALGGAIYLWFTPLLLWVVAFMRRAATH